MSFQTRCNSILDRLYERRTDRLRHVLVKRQGHPLTLTKKRRETKIRELQEIARKARAENLARRQFRRLARPKKSWKPKGRGADNKQKEFLPWVREGNSQGRGKVYVFWRRRECRYVGRTRGRGSRPSCHFKRSWFNGTTRIDVHSAHQRKSIPMLECLAIHRFNPTKNKVKAAKLKWTAKCPLCSLRKKIRTEIRTIYRYCRH
jgi:hypothetical protein